MNRVRVCVAVACVALSGCGAAGSSTSPRAAPSSSCQGVQVGPLCATPPASTPAPQPSPVSTSAALTSSCVMGVENMQFTIDDGTAYATGIYGGFEAPTKSTGEEIGDTYYPQAMAFQMTLVNSSDATADVGAIAVVFYDSTGTEQGSLDAATAGYIVPGQSLTWTVVSPYAEDGTTSTRLGGNIQNGEIPQGASTCSLVQWSEP